MFSYLAGSWRNADSISVGSISTHTFGVDWKTLSCAPEGRAAYRGNTINGGQSEISARRYWCWSHTSSDIQSDDVSVSMRKNAIDQKPMNKRWNKELNSGNWRRKSCELTTEIVVEWRTHLTLNHAPQDGCCEPWTRSHLVPSRTPEYLPWLTDKCNVLRSSTSAKWKSIIVKSNVSRRTFARKYDWSNCDRKATGKKTSVYVGL